MVTVRFALQGKVLLRELDHIPLYLEVPLLPKRANIGRSARLWYVSALYRMSPGTNINQPVLTYIRTLVW